VETAGRMGPPVIDDDAHVDQRAYLAETLSVVGLYVGDDTALDEVAHAYSVLRRHLQLDDRPGRWIRAAVVGAWVRHWLPDSSQERLRLGATVIGRLHRHVRDVREDLIVRVALEAIAQDVLQTELSGWLGMARPTLSNILRTRRHQRAVDGR
jgi:hypothetical protein